MRIGNLEIHWHVAHRATATEDGVDRTGAFAVAEDTAWWVALHQLLASVEAETIVGARNRVKETNECIAAVGAGEGVALVRRRLLETRAYALAQRAQTAGQPQSAWD